jgi:hypothetical protein
MFPRSDRSAAQTGKEIPTFNIAVGNSKSQDPNPKQAPSFNIQTNTAHYRFGI